MSLEKSVKDLEEELDKADSELYKAEEQMNQYAKAVVDSEGNMKRLRAEWMDIIEQRVESERFLGVSEYSINVTKEKIQTLEKMINFNVEQKKRFEESAIQIKERFTKGPTRLDDYFKLFTDLEISQGIAYENLKNRSTKSEN